MAASVDPSDYLQRFGAIARLYGRDGLEKLRAAHVAVIGIGGVGSWTVEALARSGVGALTLIDLDDVCITNVNRQLHALDGQIGRPKVNAIADRVRLINPHCRVNAVAEFFTKATADDLLGGGRSKVQESKVQGLPGESEPASEVKTLDPWTLDFGPFSFVVDATDKLGNKCLIITACRERGIPVLTIGGAGGKRDGTQVRVRDLAHTEQDELLRQVRRKLRRECGFTQGLHRSDPSVQVPFDIPAVFSPEKPVFPHTDGTCSPKPEPGASTTLDCASGFGTATHVTAAFGLAAAGEVVRRLAG